MSKKFRMILDTRDESDKGICEISSIDFEEDLTEGLESAIIDEMVYAIKKHLKVIKNG